MSVEPGTKIPPWTMPDVDPARMKTMAAILRDPYEIHWDPDAVERIGFGRGVINQGPLNLSYITNMLMAWQGDACVRRLQVSFSAAVFDHDSVTAAGAVTSVADVNGEKQATCDIWLERAGERVVSGTAVVALVEN